MMITRQALIPLPHMKMTEVLKLERSASLNPSALKEFVRISKNAIKLENLT